MRFSLASLSLPVEAGSVATTVPGESDTMSVRADDDVCQFDDVNDYVYQVRVFYVEPTYAKYRGIPVKGYSGTFYLRAVDESRAAELAVAEFRDKAARSGVGWVRQIVRCEACRCEESEGIN